MKKSPFYAAFACVILLVIAGCQQQQKPVSLSSPVVGSPLEKSLQQLVRLENRMIADSIKWKLSSVASQALTADYHTRALYYYLLGNRLLRDKDIDSASHCYLQMLDGVVPDTTKDLQLILLQQTGLLRASMDTVIDDQTFERLQPMIRLAEKYAYPDLWKMYGLAAETHFRYGDTIAPEKYTRMAMAHYPDPKDLYQRSIFMEELSRCVEDKGEYAKAMLYEDSALYYAQQTRDKKRLASVYGALGVLYTHSGDMNKAHALMDRSFALKQEIGEVEYADLLNKGISANEKKQYTEATVFLYEALELGRKQKNYNMMNKAYGTLYESYYQLGDYKKALRYSDSSGNAAMKALYQQQYKQVAKLQAVNDLKEEQLKTAALNKENENKNTILRQQRLIIFVLAAILLLAAGTGYLLIERRRLRHKKRSIELEQQLLRSQMEPHFIFNTLSVLQSFIRNQEPEKAAKYLNQFARLLRLNLENSRENLVALKDEVEALENYLSLQAMRFEGVFEYAIKVYDGYEEEEAYIPPMLLQPFVENAIQHGMRNLTYKGHIQIIIGRKGQALYCTIEDNGAGLQHTIPSMAGKKSLSGIITQERLAILSRQTHQPATLVITDLQQKGQRGLKVEMVIPIRPRRQPEA